MNNSNTVQSDSIKQLIVYLEKFGFKYLGPGENGDVLFTAPNGQAVTGEVAYRFVKTQLLQATESKGSPEALVLPEVIPQVDANFDSKIEVEKNPDTSNKIEKATEQTDANGQSLSDLKVKTSSPKMKIGKTAIPMPFGEGFTPKLFKPDDTKSIQDFISKSATASHSDPEVWLKILWEKFLKELSSQA